MANIKLGQEILWPWCFCFMEEPHDVRPLLPHFNRLLQFHLSLHEWGKRSSVRVAEWKEYNGEGQGTLLCSGH